MPRAGVPKRLAAMVPKTDPTIPPVFALSTRSAQRGCGGCAGACGADATAALFPGRWLRAAHAGSASAIASSSAGIKRVLIGSAPHAAPLDRKSVVEGKSVDLGG